MYKYKKSFFYEIRGKNKGMLKANSAVRIN